MSEATKTTEGAGAVKEEKKTPTAAKGATTAKPAAKGKPKTGEASKKAEKPAGSDTTAGTVVPETATKAEKSAREKMMDHYRKAYPKEKRFHVTSDNQVFLAADESLARRHQKTLDATKEVETIER